MQHEFPKHAVHTIKEFAGEFLMVVVSIVTALSLEHLVSTRHYHHLAEQSRECIVQELKTNMEETQTTIADCKKRAAGLSQVISDLRKDIKAGISAAEFNRVYFKRLDTIPFGFTKPTLRREAWEVAVANQTGTYMDNAAMRRYSAAYADMRDLQTLYAAALNSQDPNGTITVITDMELGRAEPAALLRILYVSRNTVLLLQTNMEGVRATLEAAVKE